MVPDVEKRLAEGESHRAASHHQIKQTQKSEYGGRENDIVQVSPGQDAEDTQDGDDRHDSYQVEYQRRRQAPSCRGPGNELFSSGGRYPAGGKDPAEADNNDQANPEAIRGNPTDQTLQRYAHEKAEPDKAHNPKRAGRQDSTQKSVRFQSDGPSHQRRVNAKSGEEA